MGVYSFNGNKILTTSGGGMLVSDNEEWIEYARKLSTQAKEPFSWYEHKEVGYNYRLSNVLAAIGVAQMEVLNDRIKRKRDIFKIYENSLKDIKEISFMPEIKHSKGNRWLSAVAFEKTKPAKIIKALNELDIESRYLWKPMHIQPVFQKEIAFVDGTSEELFKKGVCLPSPTSCEDEDILRVAEVVRKYASK